MGCPDENRLAELARGELDDDARRALELHFDGCGACLAVFTELQRVFASEFATPSDATMSSTIESSEGSSDEAKWFATGAHLGRYLVLEPVGAGAMGVVYSAYDPQLDRKVALKVLRPTDDPPPDATGRSEKRLLREAKTVAQLSHPNVITVHDVGVAEGTVFLAMEFVAGGTLGRWFRDAERSWRDVLAAFRQAGQGLDAAHRAGLVHRDFKPDNVLLHDDGRIIVTDFGLARAATHTATQPRRLPDPQGWAETLTRTGALVGTPAYMAPEHFEGKPCDAKSDQFAYCVALYEALFGHRPFRGDNFAALAAAVTAGRVEAPPERRVPRWLRRAVMRGLERNPDDRHPDMRTLLQALRPARITRWSGLATMGTIGLIAGAGAMAASAEPPAAVAYCDDIEGKLDDLWNPMRGLALRTAFGATQLPFADSAATTVTETLDEHARQWVEASTATCRARVEGTETHAALDAQSYCLARRRSAFRASVDVLERADANTVTHAVEAVQALLPVSTCSNVDTAGPALPLPIEAEQAEVDAIRASIDDSNALSTVGRRDDELEAAEQAYARALPLSYEPVRAEAAARLADAYEDSASAERAQAMATEALVLGTKHLHHEVTAMAALALGGIELGRQGRSDNVERWVDLGFASLDAAGSASPSLRARLYNTRAASMTRRGNLEGAVEAAQRALSLREEYWGPDHYSVADALAALGRALGQQGEHEASLRALDRARTVWRTAYGEEHPMYMALLQRVGTTYVVAGHYTQALDAYLEARQLQERLQGTDAWANTILTDNIAMTSMYLERYDDAQREAERAAEGFARHRGADSPLMASSWALLGEISLRRRRWDEAVDALQKARRMAVAADASDHQRVANYEAQLGLALLGQGHVDAARTMLRRTLDTRKAAADELDINVAESAGRLALAELAAGNLDDARALIDLSVRAYETNDPDPHQHAEARFRRARIRHAQGDDAGANDDADRARSLYDTLGDQPQRRAEVQAWLDGLR